MVDRRDMSESFSQQIIAFLPALRAFATSLCGNRSRADDLVQETIAKAWARQESFKPGSNMRAWLHTILRNHFFNLRRVEKRVVEDSEGHFVEHLSVGAAQDSNLEFRDLRRALAQLTDEQREALILVGAGGFSYQEVADISGAAVGTVKSRINRGRVRLADLMDGGIDGEIRSGEMNLGRAKSDRSALDGD